MTGVQPPGAPAHRPLAALLALPLLWSCATPPALDDIAGPWTGGRLSLRVEASAARPAQSLTASFELRGSARRGELQLIGPLGSQLAQARWQPGTAELVTAEGRRDFADLDALAEQALGERIPLAALPDWLAGRPWTAAAHTPTAAGFEQLGWQVDTSRHAEGRVAATRAAPPAVSLRVQLDRVPS